MLELLQKSHAWGLSKALQPNHGRGTREPLHDQSLTGRVFLHRVAQHAFYHRFTYAHGPALPPLLAYSGPRPFWHLRPGREPMARRGLPLHFIRSDGVGRRLHRRLVGRRLHRRLVLFYYNDIYIILHNNLYFTF